MSVISSSGNSPDERSECTWTIAGSRWYPSAARRRACSVRASRQTLVAHELVVDRAHRGVGDVGGEGFGPRDTGGAELDAQRLVARELDQRRGERERVSRR